MTLRTWPRWFAIVLTVTSGLLIALALTDLIVNTKSVGSWLPLLVIGPCVLAGAVRSLRLRPSVDRKPRS